MKGDKQKTTLLLKTAKGQIEGIIKMIDDDRYCMDISNQLLAVSSLIQKANKEVIKGHMLSCVKAALMEDKSEEKIDEILDLIEKMTR